MSEVPLTLIVEGLNDLLTLTGGLMVKVADAGPAVRSPAVKILVVFRNGPELCGCTDPVMVQPLPEYSHQQTASNGLAALKFKFLHMLSTVFPQKIDW